MSALAQSCKGVQGLFVEGNAKWLLQLSQIIERALFYKNSQVQDVITKRDRRKSGIFFKSGDDAERQVCQGEVTLFCNRQPGNGSHGLTIILKISET